MNPEDSIRGPFAALNYEERLPAEVLLDLYRTMVRIRRTEEATADLGEQREIRCPIHLYLGQEAVATGVAANLGREDYVFGNHRSHGHYVAKGDELRPLFAEFLGRETGCAGGRGGSMHLIDVERGMLGTTPIVAANIPLAAGAAFTSQRMRTGRVAVSFFGDGAVEEGVFHESMNFAAIHRLPLVFVCENNFYSSHLGLLQRRVADNIFEYGAGHSVPAAAVDGNDVEKVYLAARAAVAHARAGRGPSLLECRTYRWRGHVGPAWEFNLNIRTREEVEDWMARCPIARLARRLLASGAATGEQLDAVAREQDEEIADALGFARASAYPPVATLTRHVYAAAEPCLPASGVDQ